MLAERAAPSLTRRCCSPRLPPVNNSLSNGERAHISRRCARTFAVVAAGAMVGHGMEGNYSAKAGGSMTS